MDNCGAFVKSLVVNCLHNIRATAKRKLNYVHSAVNGMTDTDFIYEHQRHELQATSPFVLTILAPVFDRFKKLQEI